LASKYSLRTFFGLTSGSSFVGLLYGAGLDSNGFSPEVANSNKNARMYRVVLSGATPITDNFEIQPVLVYQDTQSDKNSIVNVWKSAGLRPISHFNKNFALLSKVSLVLPIILTALGFIPSRQLIYTFICLLLVIGSLFTKESINIV
jgi:hypothetical protein